MCASVRRATLTTGREFVKMVDRDKALKVVQKVQERVGSAHGRPCRLRVTQHEKIELAPPGSETFELLEFLHFECQDHGTTWREFVGGTTRLSCITRALASSAAGASPGSSLSEFEEEECDDDDSDGFAGD